MNSKKKYFIHFIALIVSALTMGALSVLPVCFENDIRKKDLSELIQDYMFLLTQSSSGLAAI